MMRLVDAALLLQISGIVTGFTLSSIFRSSEQPCLTRRCIQSAASILESMNQSYNPCEDFFSYTCGNYKKEHPIPDSQIMYDINRRKEREYELKAKAFLQEDDLDGDPEAVSKAKALFRSCVDTGAIEEQGFHPIVDALEVAGLSLIPARPQEIYDWLSANVQVQKRLGKELLLQFSLSADPQNKTLKHIYIGIPGEWNIVSQSHRQHNRGLHLKTRSLAAETTADMTETSETLEKMSYDPSTYQNDIDFAKSVLATFLSESEEQLTEPRIKKMKKALTDAVVLDNVFQQIQEIFTSPDLEPTKHTLKELQATLDGAGRTRQSSPINLTRYVTEMFEDVENVTLHLTDDTPLIVSSLDHLKWISNLTKIIPPKRIAMLFWWRIVKGLAPISTRALRELVHDHKNALYGFEYDVKSRALLCTQTVLGAFPFAVAHKVMDQSYLDKIRPGVKEMFENLRRAFKQNIASYSWLHDADRKLMYEKLDAIRVNIGLPDWTFDPETIDGYYSEISICEEHFAQSLVNYSSTLVYSLLSSFNQTSSPEDDVDSLWGSVNIFSSNAFYFPGENAMVILMPQLEYPFYDLGLEALNYGAFASLIGHELSHAFDNSGRTYDKIGNKLMKWTNTSVINYLNKTECFVDQYNSVYIAEVDRHVDGRKTLNENIADNSGLRLALTGYRMWVKDHGKEKSLPGLEGFSHEQLLYLSFAWVDCHSTLEAAMLNMLQDEHSPVHVRINITLTNTPDFFSAWKCKPLPQNHRKCRLL